MRRDGRAAFYDGEFGRGLLELGGGHFAPSDLDTSMATWCAPLRLPAWGHVLWTVPPPSQGYLTLAGASVAEASGLGPDPDDPRWAHVLVESWRAVGHDRPAVLFDGADGAALLAADRLAAAAARIHPNLAGPPDVAPGQGTVGSAVGAGGRGRHDPPVRARCGRARGLADAVQRTRFRLAPHRARHGRLPAQPRRRVLTRGRPPRRGRTGAPAAAHPLPHARHGAGRRA